MSNLIVWAESESKANADQKVYIDLIPKGSHTPNIGIRKNQGHRTLLILRIIAATA